MNSWLVRHRRPFIVSIHITLIVLANYLALWLRFDGEISAADMILWRQTVPALVGLRAVAFLPLRLYSGLWRYTSISELRNIILGVSSSSVAFYVWVHWLLGLRQYPRSVFVIDSLLLISFMGGIRLVRRVYGDMMRLEREKRVLIFGAGDAGEMIVRDMKRNRLYNCEPIGFVDDNRDKIGQRIHGVPILGTRDDLPRILKKRHPQEILIAMPRADAVTIRGILKALEPYKIKITRLPNLSDVLDGTVTVSHIRSLSVEDLLPRMPIGLDPIPVRHFIEGKRVMVTGAGGSIGSELCRQIAALAPAALVFYERYENNLFAIANDLADRRQGPPATPIIGDVTDTARLDAVLRVHRPEIIFHAAAHKHVPLMEQNPCEAVKNNVMGTRLLAEAAERHGVDRFVLISTDKAVNPTSVMGATKRIAELLVQGQAAGSRTWFFAVRFGNVLASTGSVVPRFLEQIRAGGPVTVTHPEMRRYFISIPEAVQLVLHTAAQGANGEIYVLEMGEQIKLVDIARNLIRLSGFVPDEDIAITFIGPRPGEKLCEELVGYDEVVIPSGIDKIMKVHQRSMPAPDRLAQDVARLERLAVENRPADVLAQLRTVVPHFRPVSGEAIMNQAYAEPAVADTAPRAPRGELIDRMCPACQSHDIHRSRTHSLIERARRSVSHKRPFRCHACEWRGWIVPVEPLHHSLAETAATTPAAGLSDAWLEHLPGDSAADTPDPFVLDASFESAVSPARPAFSRDLR